ncbi:hypothetical protein GALMADRAFT_209404 [Galerina marginata CBS 339.88]|uniref:Uncharacterized protein n=1 Tax=Galerina marginata (strain CBS 339.88) TaxID=685588 RepID=A0A067TG09_GALM3|nr:hypothetical protein GALMADRAFT_209404 [Galerina marginata CBS 339.88]
MFLPRLVSSNHNSDFFVELAFLFAETSSPPTDQHLAPRERSLFTIMAGACGAREGLLRDAGGCIGRRRLSFFKRTWRVEWTLGGVLAREGVGNHSMKKGNKNGKVADGAEDVEMVNGNEVLRRRSTWAKARKLTSPLKSFSRSARAGIGFSETLLLGGQRIEDDLSYSRDTQTPRGHELDRELEEATTTPLLPPSLTSILHKDIDRPIVSSSMLTTSTSHSK